MSRAGSANRSSVITAQCQRQQRTVPSGELSHATASHLAEEAILERATTLNAARDRGQSTRAVRVAAVFGQFIKVADVEDTD